MAFILRRPTKQDAQAILECHRAAILGKAAGTYDEATLKSWMPTKDKALKTIEQETQEETWIYYVAENETGIIGFGILVPETGDLRAAYVRPNPEKDVGKAIMEKLLKEARGFPIRQISLSASFNAAPFYEKFGFRIVEKGTHTFDSGAQMACLKMRLDM